MVDTKFKTFNKQTNYLGYGNVFASTQYSNHIRTDEGKDILKYDLMQFSLSRHAEALAHSINLNYYLYEYRVYDYKAKKYNVIGWLFFGEDNVTCLYSIVNGNKNYSKKKSVLDYCEQIIKDKRTGATKQVQQLIAEGV